MIVFKCNKMMGTEVNSKFFSTKRSLEKTEISIGKDGIFTRENVLQKKGKRKSDGFRKENSRTSHKTRNIAE